MDDGRAANTSHAARWVRAARNCRRISQRELAMISGVPHTTIGRIEAGRTTPRIDTLESLLAATGFEIVIQDGRARELLIDEVREGLVDRGQRRFPAHLSVTRVARYDELPGSGYSWWWGWNRIAWPYTDDWVPEYTFWRRDEPMETIRLEHGPDELGRVWDDAT